MTKAPRRWIHGIFAAAERRYNAALPAWLAEHPKKRKRDFDRLVNHPCSVPPEEMEAFKEWWRRDDIQKLLRRAVRQREARHA